MVAQPSTPQEAAAAADYCRGLVRREARNFYYGFLLLPRPKRRAVYSLYAFCRVLDDAVDEAAAGARPAPQDAVRARFRRIVAADVPAGDPDRPLAVALAEVTARHPATPRHLAAVIEGVLMDCSIARYPTMDRLRRYLFGVAAAVGLACIEVFGYRDRRARRFGVYLGYAMQMVNILRDIGEDYRRGRIYLPGEDCDRFGVTEADFAADRTSTALRRLVAFEIGRARDLFDRAQGLWPLLERDAAACPYALAQIYRALLERIARDGGAVLERRARVPTWRKLLLMARAKLAFR